MIRVFFLLALLCTPVQAQQPAPAAPFDENDIDTLLRALVDVVDYLSRNEATNNFPNDFEREAVRLQSRDYEAQKDMSAGTVIMAGAAVIGLGISSYGILLLIANLRETRKATREAARAAKAAEDAVKQERAWVSPASDPTFYYFDYDEDFQRTYELVVSFKLINTAKTPAKNIEVWRYEHSDDLGLEPEQIPLPLASVYEWGEKAGFLTEAAPLDVGLRFNESTLRSYLSGQLRLYLFLKIEWETVFREIGETIFCAELVYMENKDRALQLNRPTLDHWAVSPIGKNCTIRIMRSY